MPDATTSCVELTCLQGLADGWKGRGRRQTNGEPPVARRLLLAHLTVQSDRLNKAMVWIAWMHEPSILRGSRSWRQGAANDGGTSAEK